MRFMKAVTSLIVLSYMYVSRLWAPDVSNKPRYIKFTCSLKLIGLESPATFDKTSQYFEGHKVSTCATRAWQYISTIAVQGISGRK